MQARSHGAVSAAIRPPPTPKSPAHPWRHRHRRRADFPGPALAIHLLSEAAVGRVAAEPAHRAHRSARRNRRRRGLCHARLSLSAQCGRRTDVGGRRPARRLPRLSEAPGHSRRAPATICRDRCMATTCARVSREARAASADERRMRAPPRQRMCNCGATMTAGCCGSTMARRCLPTTWCWRSAIRRRQRRPSSRTWSHSARYISDPWSIGTLANQEDIGSVLLVGSGLTMVDAALRLAALRPRVRHIHVLSRHGWMPQAQASAPLPAHQARRCRCPRGGARLDAAPRARLSHADARRSTTPAATGARCWRSRADSSPSQWRALDHAQRARFLRHVALRLGRESPPRAGRDRWPPCDRWRARVFSTCTPAGSKKLNALDDAVEVIWRPRGAARTRAWLVDRVVNCTGPECRVDARRGSAGAVAAVERNHTPRRAVAGHRHRR